MGLFRALLITGICLFVLEYIKKNDKKIANKPFINYFTKKKINYCYIILIIVFIIELVL